VERPAISTSHGLTPAQHPVAIGEPADLEGSLGKTHADAWGVDLNADEVLRSLAHSEQWAADRMERHGSAVFAAGHLTLAVIFAAIAGLLLVVQPG
jgi:hypothetical protein